MNGKVSWMGLAQVINIHKMLDNVIVSMLSTASVDQ